MALFEVERTVRAPAVAVWERLTDWPAHGGRVPLTRIVGVSVPAEGVGARFTARTGVGRVGFDDPMEVVEWSPPGAGRAVGRCRLVKRGRVVLGWAEIEVYGPEADAGDAGAVRVVWREELGVRGVPRTLDPVVAWTARRVFSRVLDGLLRAP
ncbi:Immediate-early protein 2 [Streptomyces sp. CMB-StM0423]|uniref:Immediate-early protein 2 n=1 Tax=Streptomyces sp. CMB-StM0423 TaxID=2059884 RepID=UPI000C709F84|nr:Immediate-early protein 2 [Streptomyces sp. CMB-StM0423]AUH38932.1 Immediate-early protein 2 [Streptomyces sp. CMB-StM0423]